MIDKYEISSAMSTMAHWTGVEIPVQETFIIRRREDGLKNHTQRTEQTQLAV